MKDRLPNLAQFTETPIQPGRPFDMALKQSREKIVLFTGDPDAALAYREVLGKNSSGMEIVPSCYPIRDALQVKDPRVVPLVMHQAIDPELKNRMFDDGPKLGQLLMGDLTLPHPPYESGMIHVIGTSKQGLDILGQSPASEDPKAAQEMLDRRRYLLGDTISDLVMGNILRAPGVRAIRAHALGPVGTNIAQAMEMYLKRIGIDQKSELIIHPAGIEPMQYAEMAAGEVKKGVVPTHMECAVYYDEKRLYEERGREENVLADHQYMKLDAMQLASIERPSDMARRGQVMSIATHPTPRALIGPWEEAGLATWVKATSNAAAAEMVANGEADACITTGSTLLRADILEAGLKSRHVSGSPWMYFTVATPLSGRELRAYLP